MSRLYSSRPETQKRNWLQVLMYCNLPLPVATSLVRNSGITNFNSLTTPDDVTFKGYMDNFQKGSRDRPSVPLPAVQCLKALRSWARWHFLARGSIPTSTDFTHGEAIFGWTRYSYEVTLTINRPVAPTAPPVFVSFALEKWFTFSQATLTYLSNIRGVINLPLSYLLRDKDEYTARELDKFDFSDNEQILIHEVILDTDIPEIRADNARVYNLLVPLLQGTSAWEYVKGPQFNLQGRKLWQLLRNKSEGDQSFSTLRWTAHTALDHAALDTSNRGDPKTKFLKFCSVLQSNFNLLVDAKRPMPEDEKVHVLWRQLKFNSPYETCRPTCWNSDYYRQSFHNTITFLSAYHHTGGTTAASTRNVSSTTTSKEVVGRLPPEQWSKLTKEQRIAHLKKDARFR